MRSLVPTRRLSREECRSASPLILIPLVAIVLLGAQWTSTLSASPISDAGLRTANRDALSRADVEARHWAPGFAYPGVFGSSPCVYDCLDFDGETIIAGEFDHAGGTLAASNIVRWDGVSWLPLGPEPNLDGEVYTLTLWNGDLVVGGEFTHAGGQSANRVVRWDGSAWRPMGSGFNDDVYDLIVYRGELIACGLFTQSGGASTRRIAKWTGSSWVEFHGGADADVHCALIKGSDLYVAGQFFNVNNAGVAARKIARWDGSNWYRLGDGIGDTIVNALALYNDDVVAGGNFTQAGGITANHVARWDGANWNSIGSGSENGVDDVVHALAVDGDTLYIGGNFHHAGTVATSRFAWWNGSSWAGFCNGMNGSVYSLRMLDDGLYVGGVYWGTQDCAGEYYQMSCVGRFDGAEWDGLGEGGAGFCDAVAYAGGLVLVGLFAHSGDDPVPRVGFWNGREVVRMGTVNAYVRAVTVFNDEVYIGGDFTDADGSGAHYIARWNGSQWVKLSDQQPDHAVHTLVVYQGKLVVGGAFRNIGSTSYGLIASWSGDAWSAVGAGATGWYVRTSTGHNGELIVGGLFGMENGSIHDIARWNGAVWQDLSGGVDEEVRTLRSFNGSLVAGGGFLYAGGIEANRIARWDGSQWYAMGSGTDADVMALEVHNGRLIVGGQFTNAGSGPANHLAQWNGSDWAPMGSGVDAAVGGLCSHADSLFVGGEFRSAGGVPSDAIAKYSDFCIPVVKTFKDLLHTSIDCAALAIADGCLLIGDLDVDRVEGCAIELGQKAVWWASLATPDPLPGGAHLEIRAVGRVNDQDAMQMGTITSQREDTRAPELRVTLNFPESDLNFLYQAYFQGTLLAGVTAPLQPVTVAQLTGDSTDPMIDGARIDIEDNTKTPIFTVNWDRKFTVRLPNNTTVAADRIKIRPINPGSDYQLVTVISMTSTGIGEIRIRDEGVGSPPASGTQEPAAGRLTFGLEPVFPNPVQLGASIRFQIPAKCDVRLSVHDVTGRRVRDLPHGVRDAGRYVEAWDGRTDAGDPVSSGIYYLRLEAAGRVKSSRMVVIR